MNFEFQPPLVRSMASFLSNQPLTPMATRSLQRSSSPKSDGNSRNSSDSERMSLIMSISSGDEIASRNGTQRVNDEKKIHSMSFPPGLTGNKENKTCLVIVKLCGPLSLLYLDFQICIH